MEKIVIEHFKERLQKGEYEQEREVKSFPEKLEGSLLEVGCGTRLTYFSKKLKVCGIDMTPQMLKLFKQRYPKADAVVGDVKMLPFKNGSFDVIVSNDLLHHLVGGNPWKCKSNIEDAIREIKYVLKSQGILLIRELLAKNYLFSLIIFYVTFLCTKLDIEISLLDIHSKIITFFITKKYFKKISKKYDFKIKEIHYEEWKDNPMKRLKRGRKFYFLKPIVCQLLNK